MSSNHGLLISLIYYGMLKIAFKYSLANQFYHRVPKMYAASQ